MIWLRKLVYRGIWRWFSVRAWIRRRFTRAGLAVVGGLLVSAILGVDTEQTIAYQAFGLLFGLLAVALGLSWGFRGRFAVERVLPRFGTVGHPLRYRVTVKNLGRKAQAGLELIEELEGTLPAFEEFVAAQRAEEKRLRSFSIASAARRRGFQTTSVKDLALPVLAPCQAADLPGELTPLRRGVLRFKGVTLARSDPLGLFRSLAGVVLPDSLLVLPRRYHLPPVALPGSEKYQQGGVAMAAAVGESEEFISLRDYRQGDPLRHMHWRSWAKVGKPIIKEFQDEFFVRHALILDTFTDDPRSELFEEAVSVAASFACALQTQESLLDLMFVGPRAYCFTGGRGLAHTDQMLEILASVGVCRHEPFTALETLVLDHLSLVSGCVCVLIAWDEPRRQFIKRLRAMGVPLLVLVLAEPGLAAPLDPGPLRDEPASFHVLPVDAVAEALLKIPG